MYVIFGSAALPPVIQIPLGVGTTLQRNLSHITDLAVGDMNGDGMKDLVVADDLSDDPLFPPTPTRDHGVDGGPFNGGVYVMFGRPEWPTELDLATEHDVFIGRENGVGVFQPRSLAFGNINADRLPPVEPMPPVDMPPVDTPPVDTPPTTSGMPVDGPGDMPAPEENMGHELEDLVIGASQERVVLIPGVLELEQAGQVFVLFGRETFTPGPIEVDTGMDVTIQGAINKDQAGDAVAVGDVNGDEMQDILIGAPLSGLGVPSTTGVGKAHLVLASEVMPAVIDLAFMSSSLIAYSVDARDIDTKTGETLAIADLNNDGFGEMIISAPSDPPSFNSSGAVYVIKGSDVIPPEYQINLEADIRFEAPLPPAVLASGRLGSALGVGDFDADGIKDLVMGGPEGNVPSAGLPPRETDLAGSGWAVLHFMPVPPEPDPTDGLNPMLPTP